MPRVRTLVVVAVDYTIGTRAYVLCLQIIYPIVEQHAMVSMYRGGGFAAPMHFSRFAYCCSFDRKKRRTKERVASALAVKKKKEYWVYSK